MYKVNMSLIVNTVVQWYTQYVDMLDFSFGPQRRSMRDESIYGITLAGNDQPVAKKKTCLESPGRLGVRGEQRQAAPFEAPWQPAVASHACRDYFL